MGAHNNNNCYVTKQFYTDFTRGNVHNIHKLHNYSFILTFVFFFTTQWLNIDDWRLWRQFSDLLLLRPVFETSFCTWTSRFAGFSPSRSRNLESTYWRSGKSRVQVLVKLSITFWHVSINEKQCTVHDFLAFSNLFESSHWKVRVIR